MRWKQKPKPKEGDIRIIKKFLFFPKKIEDETRWLESAYIVQEYIRYQVEWSINYTWKDISWNYRAHTIKEILD